MTRGLVDELFAGSADACRATIGRLEPVQDTSRVTFTDVAANGDHAELTVDDRPGNARYALTFVREEGAWLLDTIEKVAVTKGGGQEETTSERERDPAMEKAIRALVLRWYRDVDPAVCDAMTDRMLDFGWEKKGDDGRAECRKNVGAADPLVDVVVRRPLLNGAKAKVSVLYTLDGDRLIDRLTFVHEGSRWLIDGVSLVGFAP